MSSPTPTPSPTSSSLFPDAQPPAKESKFGPENQNPSTSSPPPYGPPNPLTQSIQPVTKCCGASMLKVVSVITTIAAIAFLLFTFFYASGYFHFDVFIGPIGSTVFPVAAGALTLLSGIVTCLTYTQR